MAFATSYAAYYTSQQWATADDTEKRQLRAYVGVLPSDVENFGQPSGQKFTFIRKNYGQTPAYNLGASAIGNDIARPEASVPDSTCNLDPAAHGLITLFPTNELRLTVILVNNYPQSQIDLVKSDARFVLKYFGNVCYTDAYGSVHYTNYCCFYRGTSMMAKDADWCIVHNDSN